MFPHVDCGHVHLPPETMGPIFGNIKNTGVRDGMSPSFGGLKCEHHPTRTRG